MIYSDKCPHCEKETVIEKPEVFAGEDVIEYQQDCENCHEPVGGVFRVEPVLVEVRAA